MSGKELHDAIQAQLVRAKWKTIPMQWESLPASVQLALEAVAMTRYTQERRKPRKEAK